MIELPEAINLSKQLQAEIINLTVNYALPPTKPHKFCWFCGEPKDYEKLIAGAKVSLVEAFGIYVEIVFDNGYRLCFNDGVNVRLGSCRDSDSYQLKLIFSNGTQLSFTVAMYGGIVLHNGDYDNEYYFKSRNFVSPFSNEFNEYFYKTLENSNKNLSLKAFLATEQRFPGIGNGTLQDILFQAELNPRRKIFTLSEKEKECLLYCVKETLRVMTDEGGRDTEKDLFGKDGGYKTVMSKKNIDGLCPICGGKIIKESYLGGSVYYCPVCQPL